MTLSVTQVQRRRRKLLRMMRVLFLLQLLATVGLYGTIRMLHDEIIAWPVLISGLAVGGLLLIPRRVLRRLRLGWIYLALVIGLNILHITLLLWTLPTAELARGSLWALAFVPLLLVGGRWWSTPGALALLAIVVIADGLVLLNVLPPEQALPVWLPHGVLAALGAVVSSRSERHLRRELTYKEALALSESRVRLASETQQEALGQLEQLDALLAADPEPAQVQQQLQLLRQALQRSLRELRPLGERTLPEALLRETQALAQDLGIEVRFDYPGELPEIGPAAAEYLLRAAQEALHNVRAHAEASAVNVRLDYDEQAVMLTVQDDGRGCDQQLLTNGSGTLHQLRERAQGMSGSLELRSAPGTGTTVEARLPLIRW